jgi:putative transposase
MRKQAGRDQARADVSAARLAAFIASAHAHEDLAQQRLRDLEGKQVLEIIARMSPISVFTATLPPDPIRDLPAPEGTVAAQLAPVDLTKLLVLGDYH